MLNLQRQDIIVENTAPDIKHKILNKEIEINKKETEQLAKETPEKQKQIIDTIEKKIPIKKATQEVKRQEIIKIIDEQESQQSESIDIYSTDNKYRVIYSDPPWS